MIIDREKLEELDACKEAIKFFSSKYDQIEVVDLLRDGLRYSDEVKREYGKDIWNWCYWLIAHTLDHVSSVRFSVYAAELVLHIYEDRHPRDQRPRKAIEAAKAWIENPKAAGAAAKAAKAAGAAADATYATYAAAYAYAAYAANAAYAAAGAAAYAYAYAAWATEAAYAAASSANYADAANADPSIRDKILEFGIELLGK